MHRLSDKTMFHLSEALRCAGKEPPSSLLAQPEISSRALEHLTFALSKLSPRESLSNEPIRTIHHLSCTGGTMFAKCTAAMPNVTLLNEIDFHSTIMAPDPDGPVLFTPTDFVSLIKQARVDSPQELISEIFLSDIRVLRKHEWLSGRHLVLRDHSHSQFLTGEQETGRATMRSILSSEFPLRSIVTVRNPIDSWLSLVRNSWHTQFTPSSFPEYCRRYNAFLNEYEGVPVFRYEDFIADPDTEMRKICDALDLKFFIEFQSVFDVFSFSGDSGRGTGQISPRPRRQSSDFDIEAATADPEYQELVNRLDYA